LLCMGQASYARDYDVEVIIFERLNSDNEAEEVWDFSAERMAGKLQRMQVIAENAVQFETEPSLVHLEPVRQNLIEAGYRILQSEKWIQPAEVYQNAPVVSLGVENSIIPRGFVHVYRTSLIFVDIDIQLSPITPVLIPNADVNIDGGFAIYQSKYEIQSPHYFISEKRRLKFSEIHYFDHPKFGVIMGVWPFE